MYPQGASLTVTTQRSLLSSPRPERPSFSFIALPVLAAGIPNTVSQVLRLFPQASAAATSHRAADSGFLGALVAGFVAGYGVILVQKVLKKAASFSGRS